VVLDFVYDFKNKLLNGVDGDNVTGLISMSTKIKLNCKYWKQKLGWLKTFLENCIKIKKSENSFDCID